MKLGISTASFFGKIRTEDSFELINELGLDTCEVFLTTWHEYQSSFIELICEKSKEYNINIYSLHALSMQFEPELFNRVDRTFEDALTSFRLIARAAEKTKASYYTFHGPARLKNTIYKIDWSHIVDRINILNEILFKESLGACQLAYENVHWTYFNSPSFYERLASQCRVACCLDIKQANQSNNNVEEYLRVMKNGLVNIHVCDFDENGELKIPGKGKFDFINFFKMLYNINYNGPIIMELYANMYDSINDIKESIKYLRDCLKIAKGEV